MELYPIDVELDAAKLAAQALNSAGFECYIIGGAVRDILLGHSPKDFDLVTNATPSAIEEIPEFENAKSVQPAQAFGVTIVSVEVPRGKVIKLEITTYRRDVEAHLGRKLTKVEFAHIEDDLVRRDFTINALALDPLNDYLLDEVDGMRDIDNKVVRFIGNPSTRIKEDPLRVMRGIRFVHQLNFQFAKSTGKVIESSINDGVLDKIATDRLRQELNAMLLLPKRRKLMELLDRIGVLKNILPEVLAGKGVEQPKDMHAEGDVFTHTVLAIDSLPARATLRLVWATLLHDIGKPPTQKLPQTSADRIRFNSHFSVGADMARSILERLNFSKQFTNDVCWMIEYHLGIDDLPNMTPAHQRTMISNEAFSDLLELHKVDAKASWSYDSSGSINKPDPEFREITSIWNKFRKNKSKPHASLKNNLGIDGMWLKKVFKFSDGKELGDVLAMLNESYDNGLIKSESDAKEFVTKYQKLS